LKKPATILISVLLLLFRFTIFANVCLAQDLLFASVVNHEVGVYPTSAFAADLDGDFDCDLAVANGNFDSDLAVLNHYFDNVSVFMNLSDKSGCDYVTGDVNGSCSYNGLNIPYRYTISKETGGQSPARTARRCRIRSLNREHEGKYYLEIYTVTR
jgi:hypothetical protein